MWLIPAAVIVIAGVAYVVYLTTTTATLRVRTIPSGVSVSIDEQTVGVTPDSVLILSLPPGQTVLTLSREGLEIERVDVTLRRGEVLEIEQVMRPPGMVYVRGGRFTMGSNTGAFSERPAHTVLLDPYYLDRTEVTVAAYRAYDADYVPAFPGDNVPATDIAWAEADAYCRAQGKRLPTEAEWERGCRGASGETYAYGNTFDPRLGRSGVSLSEGPVEVGSYPPGNAGALDMTGNVWEWCSDWYGRDYYRTSPERNPKGPQDGERHVLRGGAWYGNASFSACTHRPGNIRSLRDPSFGFRCARDLN